MSANEPTPRFEPPPWERAAFERFRREQGAAWERSTPEGPRTPAGEETVSEAPKVEASGAQLAPEGKAGKLPEAQVVEMLARLRLEEPEASPVHPIVVNVVAALLGAVGLAIAIEAIVLFAKAGTNDTVATLVVGTISLVMVAAGGGMTASGVMLFKKYHRR